MGWIGRSALAAALLAGAGAAVAHDFWIALDDYRHDAPGQRVALDFLIGESAAPEDWELRPERVVALRSVGPAGVRDHQAALAAHRGAGDATIVLDERGSHVVAFETTPSLSDLPPTEFADYVDHEGLSAVAAHRSAAGAADKPGRELYARRAKAIVQIGAELTANALTPIGQSLEIVPIDHPHARGTAPLAFRLLFRGLPLAGARLKCERLDGDRKLLATPTTDAEGLAACAIPRSGNWKVSTVWSVPIDDTKRADYDTLFASLTFGY